MGRNGAPCDEIDKMGGHDGPCCTKPANTHTHLHARTRWAGKGRRGKMQGQSSDELAETSRVPANQKPACH